MPFNIKPLRPAPTTAPAKPAKAAALYHAENQIHSNMPQMQDNNIAKTSTKHTEL